MLTLEAILWHTKPLALPRHVLNTIKIHIFHTKTLKYDLKLSIRQFYYHMNYELLLLEFSAPIKWHLINQEGECC